MSTLLSILIPTIYGREHLFDSLVKSIEQQISQLKKGKEIVEIISIKDNKEMTIGEKRELLYSRANGLYSLQADDDDGISSNGIQDIVEAAKWNADCITYEEHIDIDGAIYKGNHSLIYNDWEGNGKVIFDDGFHYHRTPFFKSAIKTEIAKSVPIVHCRFAEDHLFAKSLKPHLKNEFHIPKQIYRYQYIKSNFNERYGIK